MPSAINLFGHDFLVTFKKGGTSCNDRPCLILTGPDLSGGGSGSGGSGGAIPYYGYLDEKCSGCDYLVFAFGDERLCSAARAAGCGCTNLLKLKVSRAICGWAGPGWYCVRDAGTADPGAALHLDDADKCDSSIEIVGGPYSTEGEASAACPGQSFDAAESCCNGGMPRYLCVTRPGEPTAVYAFGLIGRNWSDPTGRYLFRCSGDAGHWDLVDSVTSLGLGTVAKGTTCSTLPDFDVTLDDGTTVKTWTPGCP